MNVTDEEIKVALVYTGILAAMAPGLSHVAAFITGFYTVTWATTYASFQNAKTHNPPKRKAPPREGGGAHLPAEMTRETED